MYGSLYVAGLMLHILKLLVIVMMVCLNYGIHAQEVLFFSKTTDWSTIYRAWLPQRLSHKERQHAVQEDCEVRGRCRRSPRQQKWSGAPPHPPPGGRPFQGPSPHPYIFVYPRPQHNIFRRQLDVKMLCCLLCLMHS